MMLCVMSKVVKLGKAIDGSRRARSAKGKIVAEGGELSGGYSVQDTEASAMMKGDKGKAPGNLRCLRRLQVCRRKPAVVVVTVLLVWSVEHPTSLGCP